MFCCRTDGRTKHWVELGHCWLSCHCAEALLTEHVAIFPLMHDKVSAIPNKSPGQSTGLYTHLWNCTGLPHSTVEIGSSESVLAEHFVAESRSQVRRRVEKWEVKRPVDITEQTEGMKALK